MSDLEVKLQKVREVEDHPNADRLSIVKVMGYNCIAAKNEDGSHRYQVDDAVVYVPEGAVVPENLLRMGFWDEGKNKGILAGSQGNRVKAIKLRGIVSQGILFPSDIAGDASLDENIASRLNIVKWEPEIPANMSGEVFSVGIENAFKYDLDALQKQPELFEPDDQVTITEKLHGTQVVLGYMYDGPHDWMYDGFTFVSSKGLFAKGLALKYSPDNLKSNLYIRTLDESGVLKNFTRKCHAGHDSLKDSPNPFYREMGDSIRMIMIYGEIYGKGVQDLHYGAQKPEFRVFESSVVTHSGEVTYTQDIKFIAYNYGFSHVPVLYQGLFKNADLDKYRDGLTDLGNHNIREGIVIRDITGEKRAKYVSPDYLLRKGGTEYN